MIAAISARKRRATWLLCGLLLAGCTTHGRVGALPPLADPGSAAEIIVIREARFVGSALTFYVSLNGTPVYGLGNDQHVIIPLTPGTHLIGIAAGGWSGGTSLVQAVAQQRHYFRVDSAPLTTGLSLQPISAEVGHALMAKTTRISR